ncbi:MAG: PEP-CTERM sorting domain-containing protein [Gemmata sp.]
MASNRARLKRKLRKLLPVVTVTLTASPFAVWAGEAQAFFPPVWNVPPPVVVVPPVTPPPIVVVPPVSPPPFVPPPVVPPVIVVPPVSPPPIVVPPCYCPPPPCGVPEPTTVASGLIGLAAAAGYRRFRRQ